MEDNNQPLDSGLSAAGPLERLQVTPNIKNYWREISNWALFFAILGFTSLGLMVLSTLAGERRGDLAGSVISLLISGAVVFIPYWFLFQFARQLKQGLETASTEIVDAGFSYLRRFYQFIGILTIIYLVFFIVLLVTYINLQERI
jgi:hypothetical protein